MRKLILALALLACVPAHGEGKSKYGEYKTTAEAWDKAEAVDWPRVTKELGGYLTSVIAHFSAAHPDEPIYGIVIESGENWDLSVYLNTEKGYVDGVAAFRKNSTGLEDKTDEEVRKIMGRWHFNAWKYPSYHLKCPPDTNRLNEIHYEVFDALFEQEWESKKADPNAPGVADPFRFAAAEAIAMLEQSPELKALKKTDDFKLRYFDGDSLEWGTEKLMEKAREKVKKQPEK
ncbi:hypothetical protein OKA04_04130 [Luteolibacter flavescens]|uniref:Uncharacterized protein n=1 Tax=Luteolibacter flavescens TaxID=1859460 RepID=A0ABT3FK19_9BACT|nr:hypothetical protein [Luteolibacter flavescens]MCW1883902.1 hypothetical protein [Luteolibacter flavescens]